MKWQRLIADQFSKIEQELLLVLEGLTTEDLNRQPVPDCNSIGWLAWHLTRSLDRNMSEFMGKEQLWVSEKWYARFNRKPDPSDTGFSHSIKEAKSFISPSASVILEYHRAIFVRILAYIEKDLSENELDRETFSPLLKIKQQLQPA